MQKLILHSSNGKIEVLAPSNWNELTLKQLIAIETQWRPKPNVLKAFAILTNIKLSVAENLQDKDIERKVWAVVSFLEHAPDWQKLQHPKYFLIDGKPYKVPVRIGSIMFGQKVMIMQSIANIESMIDNLPLIIAAIFQPHYDRLKNKGKLIYSSERVEALKQQINNASGLDCYAIASFFFAKLPSIANFIQSDLKAYQQQQKPILKQSKNWRKVKD